MKSNPAMWRKLAPEGNEWEPPTGKVGQMAMGTTVQAVERALLVRAVELYYRKRPTTRPEIVVPLP